MKRFFFGDAPSAVKNVSWLVAGVSCLAITSAATAQTGLDPVVSEADPTEIIVTAQRRSENLRDVPISIVALSGETLERTGVMSTLDLPRLTPGLELPLNGGFTQPSIRGVSSGGSDVGDSSNVAIYVDGVYRPAQSGQLMDLPDVQQVEVLKGPQGTLYGQGAEGGAIVVTTLAPSFTTTGRVTLSYGNYNSIVARGFVSGPISDDVAVSFAGSFENRDGYSRNLLTGKRDSGLESGLVRGKLLINPTSNLSVTIAGYWSRRKDSGPYGGQPYKGRSVGYSIIPDAPKPSSPSEIALNTPPMVDVESYGGSVIAALETGAGTITSVTGYTESKGRLTIDVDYSPVNAASIFEFPLSPDQRFLTEDISFVSKDWGGAVLTVGGFFMSSKEGYRPQSFTLGDNTLGGDPLDGSTVRQFQTIDRTILAAYAELAYEVVEGLTVSAGGRYSYERQRGYADLFGSVPDEVASPYNPAVFKKFTPRVTARYKLSPRASVYANYSQGFKSGVLSTSALYSAPAKPETLTSYEVGFKGDVVSGVSLNVAAFLYNWSDLQVQRYVPPLSIYENAASARAKGIDFDIDFRLAPGLTLDVGGVYLDSKYRDYPLAGVFVPNAAGGNDNATIDASGLRLMRAPKFTGTTALNYSSESSWGKVDASASLYYNSGSKMEVSGRVSQSKYALLDVQLSLSPSSLEGMTFTIWGRNLTDKRYLQSLLQTNFADGVSYSPPRTFGVRAKYDF